MVYPVIFYLWRARKLDKSLVPTSEGEIEEGELHEAGHQA
jgi:Cu(I)/Ag(I) efflux system membrane protein CusA/SilA